MNTTIKFVSLLGNFGEISDKCMHWEYLDGYLIKREYLIGYEQIIQRNKFNSS